MKTMIEQQVFDLIPFYCGITSHIWVLSPKHMLQKYKIHNPAKNNNNTTIFVEFFRNITCNTYILYIYAILLIIKHYLYI